MNVILITSEELRKIIKASTAESLKAFYDEKKRNEKKSQNLSVRETATILNVSELTVRNYIRRGLIRAERIGNRIFINRKKLEESMKEVKSLKYRR